MLVVIGLLVGGVLVGQSLVSAAEVRAQITQIEKYNSAANSFHAKFDYLPGDMTGTAAQQFNFAVGTSCTGRMGGRDGNGLLDGYVAEPLVQAEGETALFWQDLSSSASGNLIDGTFPNGGAPPANCAAGNGAVLSSTTLGDYFPPAKIGHANFVYAYENNGANWYGVSQVLSTNSGGGMASGTNISVVQAYNLDKKVDDGLPLSGNVQALYINSNILTPQSVPNTANAGGTSTSCYDTTTGTYSITVANGSGGNCALSFKFQ